MNDILSKVVEELAKENPNIDYVRGMLETVLAMNKVTIVPTTAPSVPLATVTVPQVVEGIPIPTLDRIKKIAEESQE